MPFMKWRKLLFSHPLASHPLPQSPTPTKSNTCTAEHLSLYVGHNCNTLVGLELTFSGCRKPCSLNTAVMVIDLEWWRSGDYARKIEEWMELQKRIRICELGPLSPFLWCSPGT
ncbi:hypothetical protein QN277_028506 [Acacia crassicarpa]|uniref:Uncharacterized protein n=1 Tax=Acacia crassicarpa TaxID=499986 RepID=A0AAE1J5S2_9FABA|nr:hypothetical protein QN277_028506 [Acacia crassicarpa]